jgi:hypothetical protein
VPIRTETAAGGASAVRILVLAIDLGGSIGRQGQGHASSSWLSSCQLRGDRHRHTCRDIDSQGICCLSGTSYTDRMKNRISSTTCTYFWRKQSYNLNCQAIIMQAAVVTSDTSTQSQAELHSRRDGPARIETVCDLSNPVTLHRRSCGITFYCGARAVRASHGQ